MSDLSAELNKLAAAGGIQSRGLQQLERVIADKVASNFTAEFEDRWQKYAGGLEQLGSYRVRLTLDDELHICGAALTAIQKEQFVKAACLVPVLLKNFVSPIKFGICSL